MIKESPIKAVIFDIDGTLTKRICWNYLAEYLGASAEAEQKNYFDWKNGLITFEECDQNILKFWRTENRGNKAEFIKAFETIALREDAFDTINYLKSIGKEICLITGAMDLYAEIIARRLGVQYFYGNTVLHWDEKDEIKSFDYTPDQSQKKLEQFDQFCKKLNLRPEECVAVGDSFNDYGLFDLTKRGIAIRTIFEDKELERLAWKIVENLSEIKEIIK